MTTEQIKAQFEFAKMKIQNAPEREKLGWVKVANGLALILEARQ